MSSAPEKYSLLSDLWVANSELRLRDDNDYDSKKTSQKRNQIWHKKDTLKIRHAKQNPSPAENVWFSNIHK